MFRVSQPVSVNKQSVRTDSPCDNVLRRGDSMVDYIETRREGHTIPLQISSASWKRYLVSSPDSCLA